MIPLKDDNPTSSRPIVSYSIVFFCVIIFLAQLGLNEIELREFTFSYGLIPSVLMGIDQLPENIKNSKILSGNDLAILASSEYVPEKKDFPNREKKNTSEKHILAKDFLREGNTEDAWQILL